MDADPWQLHGIRLEYALNGQKGRYPSGLFFQGSSRCPLPPASILSRTAATGFRPVVGATAESLSPGCRSTLFSCQRTDTAVCQNPRSTACRDKTGRPWGRTLLTNYTKLFPTA